MRYNIKHYKYLDGEELFKEYFEVMGTARSVAKLVNWCVSRGTKNPLTGKPPTRMGVWKAMWRWALAPENKEKAYEIFKNSMATLGDFVAPEDWNKFIKDRAAHGLQFGPQRYEKLIKAQ